MLHAGVHIMNIIFTFYQLVGPLQGLFRCVCVRVRVRVRVRVCVFVPLLQKKKSSSFFFYLVGL
jgi:hypothetical protein